MPAKIRLICLGLIVFGLSLFWLNRIKPIRQIIASNMAYPGLIAMSIDNYLDHQVQLQPYHPYEVFGWATNPAIVDPAPPFKYLNYQRAVENLRDATEVGDKTLVFSSWQTLDMVLSGSDPNYLYTADDLASFGINMLAYNAEGLMTPQEELDNILNPDPTQNAVVKFINIANIYNFSVIWGSYRNLADQLSDDLWLMFINSGLDSTGLQEQKFIETACAQERIIAVSNTVNRLQNLAGANPLEITVQIMPSRCIIGNEYALSNCPQENIDPADQFQHCDVFVEGISSQIQSLAIWASDSTDSANLVPLVTRLRLSQPDPSPSPNYLPGDVNHDYMIDSADIGLALRNYATDLISHPLTGYFDAEVDNYINAVDFAWIVRDW